MTKFNQTFDNNEPYERMEILYAMHILITALGDEDIYDMWIDFFPDEPSEDDYDFIANDPELYNDCVKLFCKIAKKFA